MTLKPKANSHTAALYWKTFGLCFFAAVLMLLPLTIQALQKGEFFTYIGDYNEEGIPFLIYSAQMVQNGGTYSWATDVGSGFLTSYSFYTLGSPFFWLFCWLPAKWVPYFIPLCTALKLAVGGAGAYLWCKRWCKDPQWAVLAGLLYAMSGYSMYNQVYFHFPDVIALFPYLMAAFDAALWDESRGPFLLMIAINLLNNYFFFFGEAIFLILYFACMLAMGQVRLTKRLFTALAVEVVIGILLSGVLLVPSVLYLMGNERASTMLDGVSLLMYKYAEHYWQIFNSAFLLPDSPYKASMYPDAPITWSHPVAYLPAVGIAGGLALFWKERRHPFSKLLQVSVIFAFVPVLNALFSALNAQYYARWYYMPLMVLAGATAIALDRAEIRDTTLPRGVKVTALCTASALLLILLPSHDLDGNLTFGVVEVPLYFWAIFIVSMGGVLLFALALRRSKPEKLAENVLMVVLLVAGVGGMTHSLITYAGQADVQENFKAQSYDSVEEVKAILPDSKDYRIESVADHTNLGLWFDKSCIQAFNSTTDSSIVRFYKLLGIGRGTESSVSLSAYPVRGLLSVRYILVMQDGEEQFLTFMEGRGDAEGLQWGDGSGLLANSEVPKAEVQTGWNRMGETTEYVVYENENWVPMGYAVDHYMSESELKRYLSLAAGKLMMKSVVLDDELVAQYEDVLTPLPEEEISKQSYADYVLDCAARRERSVTDFEMNDYGFTAATDYADTEFVVFSVPYSTGFTALVNGEETPVEEVDGGLMGIVVPGGHCDIVFEYETPGGKLGLNLTWLGLGAAVVYMTGMFIYKKKRAR